MNLSQHALTGHTSDGCRTIDTSAIEDLTGLAAWFQPVAFDLEHSSDTGSQRKKVSQAV